MAKPKQKAAVHDTKKKLVPAARPHSVEKSSSESEAEDPDDAMQEETGGGSNRHDQPSNDGNDSDQSTGENEAEEEESVQHSRGNQDEEQCDAVDLLGGQAIDDGALKQLYRSLPVKNANAKQTLLHGIMGQQDSWHLSLRLVGAKKLE